MAVVHELERLLKWSPSHPHRVKWRASCACWWVGNWHDDPHDALADHDTHVSRHAHPAAK